MPEEPEDLRFGEELLIEASDRLSRAMVDGLVRLHYQTMGFLMAEVARIPADETEDEEQDDE